MFLSIIKYSEFTCGVILLLFAVLQFTYKNRGFINYNIAGLYFCLSYVILSFWAFKSGLILHFPPLLHSDVATSFAIGPFVYFYIKTVLGIRTESYSRYMLHFIPAAAALSAIIINNIVDDSLMRYYRDNPSNYPVYNLSPFIQVIDYISDFYLMFYFILTIRYIYTLLKKKSHKSIKVLRTIYYYMTFIIVASALMMYSSMTGNALLCVIAIYLLTLSGIWYFIFSFRHPEFTQNAIKEARVIRYENSIINGTDADVTLKRLDELMEEDKIYMNFGLTLQMLSSLLMITPHQLSKILNSKRKMNFRNLINSYRIKEAMVQMTDNPEKTILEIALDSGFNSKSSFNAVFMKFAGIAPRDYRKSMKK